MSSKKKTTGTKEDGKPALLPELRFPEFQRAEGWKETTLNVIADPVTGRATQGEEYKVLSLSAEHGIVLQSEFFGKKVAGDNSERYLKIARNDFVYNDRTTKVSTFGTIKRLSKHSGGIVSPIYKCFRFHEDENPVFWEWYFESGIHNKALAGLVNEGARAGRFNISITQFLSTNAWRPRSPEQNKIAECLSSVDEVVAAQARKVDALKTHKKGLMQQLFPREGESQPRLRFQVFQNAGDWTEDALGNICSILNNRRRPITSSDRRPGPYPYYGASGVVDYVDDYIFDERVVLVGEDGAKWGAFERTAFVVEGKFWVNNHAHVLKPHGVNEALLENYLTMADLGAFVTGAAPPKLTLGKLKEIPVPIPPDEKESKAIADCLISLDTLIATETQKLETLKRHKRGLLQQLFPSSEEAEA